MTRVVHAKRFLPTAPQVRVLRALRDGAELRRYEHPNADASWSLVGMRPLNASANVGRATAEAIRCAGWIARYGDPTIINSGTRQLWTLTSLGRSALEQVEGVEG